MGIFSLVWLYGAATAPAQIPGHFAADGSVDHWEGKWSFLITLGLTTAGLVALFELIARLSPKIPEAMINMPHKEYWMRPENRQKAAQLLAEDMRFFSSALVLLMAWMLGVTLSTADLGSSNSWLLMVPTFIFIAIVVGYSLWMMWGPRYRPNISN